MSEISAQLDEARERLRSQIPAPGYLTKPEAAQLARCSVRTIERAIDSRSLRAFKPAARVLLREEDVRHWIESQSAFDCNPSPAQRSRTRRSEPGSVANLRALDPEAAR